MKVVNLVNQQFGKWTVLRQGSRIKNHGYWLCRCICGTEREVSLSNLRQIESTQSVGSCGCLKKETLVTHNTTHGLSGTVVSALFWQAKSRAKKRGLEFSITMADVVVPDICPLLEIPIHKKGYIQTDNSPSLDRIDSSLGYVPGNVQVISQKANTIKSTSTFYEFERLYINWRKQRDTNTLENPCRIAVHRKRDKMTDVHWQTGCQFGNHSEPFLWHGSGNDNVDIAIMQLINLVADNSKLAEEAAEFIDACVKDAKTNREVSQE